MYNAISIQIFVQNKGKDTIFINYICFKLAIKAPPLCQWLVVLEFFPNPVVPGSKTMGESKVDSAFHPSEVDLMSTRNF